MPLTRHATVTTPLGKDALLFESMNGTDGLSRMSEYRVRMLSADNAIDSADLLGKTMSVNVQLADDAVRYFHGHITRFAHVGWSDSMCVYEATLHPWPWLMTRSSDCRIFQQMTVKQILEKMFTEVGGVANVKYQLTGTYTKLDYCVQYRETHFDFVCRLMEHHGIYYFYQHEADKHTLVITDSASPHETVPGYETVVFGGDHGMVHLQETVQSWSAGSEIQSGRYVLRDYNFEKPKVKLEIASELGDAPTRERYDYPGRFQELSQSALATSRMQQEFSKTEQISLRTNVRGLGTGCLFTLEHHPREDQNREYLVTSGSYQFSGASLTASAEGTETDFHMVLTVVSTKDVFKPASIIPKPFVRGPQTAFVVGSSGEEIWTDEYGRVKVQFHWDRKGKGDEESSCWLRVAQTWAGAGWGSMFIPRVGMEVVVSFLEGDPDQPIITGCVYNKLSMPPYDLPANQTRSTIMSNSSKGGEGYNEMRFEDKKGSEEVYVQAEKDHNRVVKNNDTLKVGFEKKDKGDQTIAVFNDKSVDIGNDHKEHIGNDQNIDIDNNQTVMIKGDQKITSKKTIVIEATTSIELKVGGSSILIEPAKITIKSTEIAAKADANVAVEAGAMMKIKSGAVMTIEGALVKIN